MNQWVYKLTVRRLEEIVTMDGQHRKVTDAFYSALAELCDIDSLLPRLVEKNVLTQAESQRYTNPNESRSLFSDIQLQGGDAFPNLVSSLREIRQDDVAFLLEEKIKVNPGTKLFDDNPPPPLSAYSTHSKDRGHVLIINIINYPNNEQRKGAATDARNLKELFEDMGLTVTPYTDLTAMNMTTAIRLFASNPQLENVDMVFVIIMGHGLEKDGVTYIFGTDNRGVSTKWVEMHFENANCQSLQKKPKIFVYQSCRGSTTDLGVPQATDVAKKLRTREDMLIAHSTLPGNVAIRDEIYGSWYIQIFCEVMMNHACHLHLDDIFKIVDRKLQSRHSPTNGMQTSQTTSEGFNKHCYVHPKIYKGDNAIRNIHDDSVISLL